MTTKALLKTADLKKMAAVAKAENVAVEMEVNGVTIRVRPLLPSDHRDSFEEHEEIRL